MDRTPFYAESGGQVGDTGRITGEHGAADVTDTQSAIPSRLTLHRTKVAEGELSEGDTVDLAIDGPRRDAIRRNHTATHLLHGALRAVLGTHVASNTTNSTKYMNSTTRTWRLRNCLTARAYARR